MSSPLSLHALESQRFGIRAARAIDPDARPGDFAEAARAEGVDLLTLRLPAEDLDRLAEFTGAGYQIRDCLSYWQRPLSGLPPTPEALRPATPADAEAVADIAEAAFAGYIGHYHTDPRLNAQAATEAYVDWARRSISEGTPALLSLDGARITGFLTFALPDETGSIPAEIVLNAVHPADQSKGHYTALVQGALQRAAAAGAHQVEVSTQVTNIPVQRVWARCGFAPAYACYTLHKWFDHAR